MRMYRQDNENEKNSQSSSKQEGVFKIPSASSTLDEAFRGSIRDFPWISPGIKICSVETDMNGSSHPKHENLVNTGYWELSPPQGPGTARRGKFGFRGNRELKPPRERPAGAAAPIVTGVWGHQPPSYLPA